MPICEKIRLNLFVRNGTLMKRIMAKVLYSCLFMCMLVACSSAKSNDDAHPIPAIAGVYGSTWYETYGEDKDGNPLNWIVLEQDKNKLFLLSRYALEEKKYDEISKKDMELLLTSSDVDKYLKTEDKRIATDKDGEKQNWWIRSTDEMAGDKIYVDVDGNIKTYDESSNVDTYFRPAMWIDIKD